MERRNRKEKEKQTKGDSITKHRFPLCNHTSMIGEVNAETRPKEKTLCALLSEMGLSTGHTSKGCLTSGCSLSIWAKWDLCTSVLCVVSRTDCV